MDDLIIELNDIILKLEAKALRVGNSDLFEEIDRLKEIKERIERWR